MKVLYEVRDSEGCNYTKCSDISDVSCIFEGVSNRAGMIEVLIVKCGDVMSRCLRTGYGD